MKDRNVKVIKIKDQWWHQGGGQMFPKLFSPPTYQNLYIWKFLTVESD